MPDSVLNEVDPGHRLLTWVQQVRAVNTETGGDQVPIFILVASIDS